MKASLEALANDSIDSSFMKNAISALDKMIDLIHTGTKELGTIPTIMMAISTAGSLMGKNLGILTPGTMAINGVKSLRTPTMPITDFATADKALTKFQSGTLMLSQQGKTETIEEQWKRIDSAVGNATGSLQAYGEQCKMLNQPMSSDGYLAFLRDGGYTKGWKGANQTIATYNKVLAAGKNEQALFAAQVTQTNGTLGAYLASLGNAKASMASYGAYLVQTTVKTIALRAASMALNMGLSMVVGMVVGKLYSAFEKWIHKNDELIEKSKEAASAVRDLSAESRNLAKTTDEIGSKYARLAQGVDQFGRNVSLDTDEYQEYLDYSNQLAELYPSLVKGTDGYGNSLLGLSGTYEEIIGRLQRLLELEQQANSADIASKFNTQVQGLEASGALIDYQNAKKQQYAVEQGYQIVYTVPTTMGSMELVESHKPLSEEEKATLLADIKANVNDLETDIEAQLAAMRISASAKVGVDLEAAGVNSQAIAATQSFVTNALTLDNLVTEFGVDRDVETFVETGIIAPIQNASPDVQQAFADLMSNAANMGAWDLETQTSEVIHALGLDEDAAHILRVTLNLVDEEGKTVTDVLSDILFADNHYATAYQQQGKNWAEYITLSERLKELSLDDLFTFALAVPSGPFASAEDHLATLNTLLDEFLQTSAQVDSEQRETAIDVGETIATHSESIKGLNTLREAYESLISGNYTDSDLFELFSEFPELAVHADNAEALTQAIHDLYNADANNIITDLREIADSLPDGAKKAQLEGFIAVLSDMTNLGDEVGKLAHQFESLSDAISNFSSVSDAIDSAKEELAEYGQFSLDTLGTLLDTFANNGEIQNAIAEYLGGLRSAEDLMRSLTKAYEDDAKSSARYLLEKLQYNEEYYEHCRFLDEDFVNTIKDNYGVDLSNCRTYAQAKIAILEQIAKVAKQAETSFTAGLSGSIDISQYFDPTTGQYTAAYEALKQGAVSAHDAQIITLVQAVAQSYQNYLGEFDSALADITTQFESANGISSDATSASETTDAWKEAAEAELATLEHLNNMKLISAQEYYDGLNRINNKYYRDHQDKYLSEYRSMLEKARSAYIEMVNDQMDELKYQYDMEYITAMEYYSKLRDLNNAYYKDRVGFEDEYKDHAVDIYSGLHQAYVDEFEDKKGDLDHLLAMDVIDEKAYYFELEKLVDEYYKGRIEFVEEYKDAEEEIYQALHDMKVQQLQEEIDQLRQASDENETLYNIEQKRIAFLNARRQKSERVYNDAGGGWTWQVNQQELKDTEREWKEALADKEIEALEKLVDALEENAINLNYVDPETGERVQAQHFDLLTQTQYEQLYAATFGSEGMKNMVDSLADASSSIRFAADMMKVSLEQNPPLYFNIEQVVANDAEEFAQSMSNFLKETSNLSALTGSK